MASGTGSPLQFGPGLGSVVRLNRRVLHVLGAILIAVFVVGFVALRAQGLHPPADPAPGRFVALPAASGRWFDKVPDRESPRGVALDQLLTPLLTTPAQALRDAATAAATSASTAATSEELEAQRHERAQRAAMSAPIGVTAFEARGRAGRTAGESTGAASRPSLTGVIAPPAALAAAQTALGQAPAPAGTPVPADPKLADLSDTLRASVRGPMSPYEVKAGTIIPAVMLSAINSDLPGQIIGQARENVFDTETGQHLLVPQGTRLVGLYDHHIVYGQERVLISWKRLIFPNGASLSLKDGMPGTDALGAAGFTDEVNNHYLRIFGNALLLSIISAGVQLSQTPDFGRDFRGPSAGNILGASVGQQLGSTASELIRRGTNIAPTLEIRPGYTFNIMVTQDMVFPGPYDDARRP